MKIDPNDPLVKEYRELSAALRRLQEQRKSAEKQEREDPAKSIKNFYGVLEHMRTEFLKQNPQAKKDIIGKLIEEIEIHQLSPHLYLMRIVWIKPIAGERDDVALLWRATATKAPWSTEEETILQTLYPEADILTLMQALPDKAMNRMRTRASTLGIRRQQRTRYPFYETITWKDLEVAKPEEREVLWEEMNRMARSTKKRGRVAVSWLLPFDEISFLRLLVIRGNEEGSAGRTPGLITHAISHGRTEGDLSSGGPFAARLYHYSS